jgi:enoyl-CoA hydratase/carnithine racemase
MPVVRRDRIETGIDVVTLDRPDTLDALSYAQLDDLEAALKACDEDGVIRRHAQKGHRYG